MKNVTVSDTRNFALIGHSGEGKTSLGEALLHAAGATRELGRVEDGTSLLNFQPEEQERGTTLTSSVFAFDWENRHFTLVDTPGDSNFQADGRIALTVLDGAVLVVSAVGGAKVGTARMWNHAQATGASSIAFVNGMNRERADFDAAVESLRGMGASPAVVTLPIGAESEFQGVVDLIQMRARTPDGDAPIPDALNERATQAREQLVEAVAEADDTLLEKYFEAGELTEDELRSGLVAGTHARSLLPVFCGAANAGLGIESLLWAVSELLPAPDARPPRPGTAVADDSETEVAADPDAVFSAVVFKSMIDRYAGTLSVMRIYSGRLTPDTAVLNASTEDRERLGKLLLLRGGEHQEADEAGPGDIVAVAKLKSVRTGHALTAEKNGVRLAGIPIPQGVISYAIQAKSKGDEDKVYSSLGRLVDEDPTLQLSREASTGEFLLTGMGELHVRTTVQKLQRMFGVEVVLKTPKVPYRETVTRKAENVEGKLKKQTGGKGMYGVCYLTIEPRAPGDGFEFVDEVKGGNIPRSLIPAVEKGVVEACEAGPLAGFPVVDVRVRCLDGKHHSVDSNEMAFKLAGSFGFKAAVALAKPALLEPLMDVEVSIPDSFVGDVMGDLSSRRGKVQASEAQGASQRIRAQVPMSEMLEYASTLTSMTGGQGEFHMEFSHYEPAPAHVREKVVAEAAAREESS